MNLREVGDRLPLAPELLQSDAPDAARQLLGSLLVRREADGTETIVRIVETEAYREDDAASHSARGRTPRTEAMFGPPGTAYTYFTYGMHWCCNVTCEATDVGAAVLLRAGVLLTDPAPVRQRVGQRRSERDLLRGPARLASGLGIDRGAYGLDLLDPDGWLHLASDGYRPAARQVVAGPRVGVREAADRRWRFHIAEVPEVSRYTRHRTAPPPQP